MSLTSIGIASLGLLDGGNRPMLHLATEGLIRLGGVVTPPAVGGGGRHIDSFPNIIGGIRGPVGKRKSIRQGLTIADIKAARLEELRKKITAASFRDLLADIPTERLDIKALQVVVDLEVAELPQGKRKVILDVDPDELIIGSDINLRLLLLLGV